MAGVSASGPVEVRPVPPAAESAVTVYYEKLPTGELRQVSTAPAPPKSGIEIRPVPPQPGFQFRAPAPTSTLTPMAPQAAAEPMVALPAPRIEIHHIPVARPEPIFWSPATVQSRQPVTYSYQKFGSAAIQPVTYSSGEEPMQVLPPVVQSAPAAVVTVPDAPATTVVPPPAGSSTFVPVRPADRMTEPPAPVLVQQPTVPVMPAAPPTEALPSFPSVASMLQQPDPDPAGVERTDSLADYGIETSPPTLKRLFRMESERQLQARMIQEIQSRPVKPGEMPERDVSFPTYRPLTDQPFQERRFGGLIKQIEPNYVMFGRLYAEEPNSERYGWDFGMIQPLWSTAAAFKDFALLPYNFAARPHQRFETSAGKCYPGDPVPYLIYPLEMSATGAGWETFVIVAGFALIP